MDVLVSGSSGLIGTALRVELAGAGHRVVRLVRGKDPDVADAVSWDPEGGVIEAGGIEGVDAVVHLAGESIAEGRWTAEKRRRIRESRTRGTRLLAETLAGLDRPPGVFVSASASGYYGDRGNELLREESAPGTGFLPDVCREWEAAADPAREAGIRVVHPRFGIVLSKEGGALAQTLPLFRRGLGGPIGSGRQYWSWVHLDDVTGMIVHALTNEEVEGPVNVSSPDAPTNAEYTRTLGRVLGRPAVLPAPAPALRLALGGLADALLLASVRMEPARLKETGYRYRHPELEGAFRHLLGE
jgi:uncharacterized protein (TIGR01777 family)